MAPFSPYDKRPDFPIHLLITKKALLSRFPLKAVPLAQTEGFEPSCRLPDNLISSQARYGHFDTSADTEPGRKSDFDYYNMNPQNRQRLFLMLFLLPFSHTFFIKSPFSTDLKYDILLISGS